ncbi:hypothetical protein C5E07_05150 [Pseudoclavibacter sp. RFBJ3]|uniref:hypothetical protein n=1 Tax=unclassified Pseudoclavibacter TaxID=2615177 RepID=UPI000CE7362B|nr:MULTISPECIES: hypothetical protein [unclassified Pseudoclavibacter]PPF84890.1 hypothetical protein C5C12_05855 [Pseudoclavibacter sp. RFBJ5]PPF93894.1 hypothetical protein C5E07_05150 [Pseudoclavibacter sp. RFBJ3]PPF98612.1 hypothetical protein C5C19_08135 [Pseudoclavibacter sp. RFBH5]PPG24427.1 hypothetical protein C5E13_06735 [Pseudoclavibacter sp. RFBI4]
MSPDKNTADVVERNIALEGEAADAWIEALGWSATAPSGRLRLFADLIRVDPFAIGRIRHSPATFTFAGQRHWHWVRS